MYHYKLDHYKMNVSQTIRLIQLLQDNNLIITRTDNRYVYVSSFIEIDIVYLIKVK